MKSQQPPSTFLEGKREPTMSRIHHTAVIDPTAEIDESVVVGPYSVIGPHVVIGAGTVLHNHVTVQSDTTVGSDNVFYPFSVIGADPQDRKFCGEPCFCRIGDRNTIREHVTIHRGTGNGGCVTIVGSDNLIMVAAHIAHDCHLGNRLIIANQVMLAGHVRVHDGANIGGGVGVHHYATIGTCAFVGGLARISKDVPPYMIVEGNPAEVRAVNAIAMMRSGYPESEIDAMKEVFKRLFRDNGAPMAEKIVEIRRAYPGVTPVLTLCDALDATGDGVHGRALEVTRPDDKRTGVVTAETSQRASVRR